MRNCFYDDNFEGIFLFIHFFSVILHTLKILDTPLFLSYTMIAHSL